MIYKIINSLCPDSLKGKLVTIAQISNYSKRHVLHLDIPRQCLEFSKRDVFYCGEQTWNEIPLNIRMDPTVNFFKKKLREFLHS